MTNPNFDDEADKPLDPAMERVRRKMIRLQIVSAGMIVVSLMAVLVAVVYKARRGSETTIAQSAAPASALVIPEGGSLNLEAQLPVGFTMNSASLNGDRILITGTNQAGKPELQIFDMARGRVIATIAITTK